MKHIIKPVKYDDSEFKALLAALKNQIAYEITIEMSKKSFKSVSYA